LTHPLSSLNAEQTRIGASFLKFKTYETEAPPKVLESFEAKILRLSTRNTQKNAHADVPIQLREFFLNFLRSVNKRLPKFYNDRMDSLA
jgi:hypothetical protein